MILEEAVDTVVSSLKKDESVQAIFLKGSMGRNEHDEFSDIDLYCLVNAEDLDMFLPNRMRHIRAYKELLFYDEIFIVAPQILAVYENLVHLDLFTVTKENYVAKDFIKVLYDPDGRLAPLAAKQNLALEPHGVSGCRRRRGMVFVSISRRLPQRKRSVEHSNASQRDDESLQSVIA